MGSNPGDRILTSATRTGRSNKPWGTNLATACKYDYVVGECAVGREEAGWLSVQEIIHCEQGAVL